MFLLVWVVSHFCVFISWYLLFCMFFKILANVSFFGLVIMVP